MQPDVDHIRQLVIEELTGIISDADAALLQQMITENHEVRSLYQQFRQELDTPEMRESTEMMAYLLPAAEVLAAIKRKKRIRYIASIASAAAVVGIAIGLYTSFHSGKTPPEMAAAIPGQHIELQLANGKTIDLSAEKQQVQVDNITLNNAQKTLSYLSDGNTPAGWATLNVPAGKDYKVRLSDGTEVWLNATTRLQFPFNFNGKTREVTVQGEAYLKVARNTQQPFIVHLPHGTIKVLGTAFNVNSYDSGLVKIALVDGAVQMEAQGEVKVLKPGFQVSYGPGKAMQVAPFEKTDVLSWQRGLYLFEDLPMEDICKVIPRWFGITTIMDNQEVAQRHFTGSIDRNKPLKVSLEHLKATGLMDYYFDKDNVLHIK